MLNKIRFRVSYVSKMRLVLVVFLCNLSVLASGKVNYCGSKMCSHTNAHTFCQFTVTPGPQCIGYMEAPLSSEEKMRVVARLNLRRAAAASGRLRGFPAAGNMLKLMWIDELAREAQVWADQCEPPRSPEANDACRDLYSVSVGQCVASVVGEAPGLRPESMVDLWYMQSMHYKGNITSYDPPSQSSSGNYADFAQLVYAKSYLVGCGRSRFMTTMRGRVRSVERLVCNFAPRGPNTGRPLWTMGPPATACPPRSTADFSLPSLCAIQRELDESDDQDNLWSLEEHVLLDTLFEIEKNESLNYVGSIDEIFLTKIAIATISPDIVSTDESSVQKRDINNDLNVSTSSLNTLDIMDDIMEFSTVVPDKRTNAFYSPIGKAKKYLIRPNKGKVNIIGRPRSYNMQDLTEDGKDSRIENPNLQMQDMPNTDKHFDVDYEFVEHSEEVVSSTNEEPTRAMVSSAEYEHISSAKEYTDLKEDEIIHEIQDTITKENTNSYTPAATQKPLDSDDEFNHYHMKSNDTDAVLDEYLSDPETVRQLQEELDRMEKAISSTMTTRSDKVRRDLRDRPSERYENFQDLPINNTQLQQFSDMLAEEERNRSMERNPMLNMVMKYMPYLKNYKDGFIKGAAGRSKNTAVYNFIIMLTSIIINVL